MRLVRGSKPEELTTRSASLIDTLCRSEKFKRGLEVLHATSLRARARALTFQLTALLGCALLMTSCVNLGLPVAAARASTEEAKPPQRQLPATAQEPCELYVLPKTPATLTLADLEIAYVVRGSELVVCNAKRELAVKTHEQEHADELAWRDERAKRNCPWYKFGTCRAKP